MAPTKIVRFGKMVGGSRKMRRVYSHLRKAAAVDMPILLIGETGCGKEIAAKEVHVRSGRSAAPYVAFNAGAMAPELVASELFGHAKGSFTGANENKKGLFREANGGTLFLDEIGTMEMRTQVALLRALEDGKIRPLGGKRDVPTDVRIIAATNEDLEKAVKEGRFRDDLLYRLRVLCVKLPPLRHRPDDIPMLCRHFIRTINAYYGFEITGISDEALHALQVYEWPGNLRELKNVLAQATVTAGKGDIDLPHIPSNILGIDSASDIELEFLAPPERDQGRLPASSTVETAPPVAPEIESAHSSSDGFLIPKGASLEEVQRLYTLKTLEECQHNKTEAAKRLKVSRKALYDKLLRWGDAEVGTP